MLQGGDARRAEERCLCVAIAVAGFYLLCVKEGFSIGTGDLLVLCCAFFFSIHIMVIDHFTAGKVDGVRMSCVQFAVVTVVTLVSALILESPIEPAVIGSAIWPIVMLGIGSSGIAYTLQIIGQKDLEPTTASLIMSLESVFAALGGWWLLNERMKPWELLGCGLVFAAVLISQLPDRKGGR